MCGLAGSLPTLVAARLACGLSAGWIIPLAMAFLGDVIPYERRQQVLGTFLSGQILGQLFGQAAGGVLGDLFGWRNVFFFLAALFAVATVALLIEFFRNPITHAGHATATRSRGFVERLCHRAALAMGARGDRDGFHRKPVHVRRLRIRRRRSASAFRHQFRPGRDFRRRLRDRRIDLQPLGACGS